MAAAIPEAAAVAGESGAAAGGGGAAGGGLRGGRGMPRAGASYRPRHASPKRSGTGPQRASRPAASRGRRGQPEVASREGQPQVAPEDGKGKDRDGQGQGQGGGGKDRGKPVPPPGLYQRIVIAEFIATMLIIALSPFLVSRTATSDDPELEAQHAVARLSLSRPLVRMTAACLVFFLLALVANGREAGRVAAAGGGLVMLGALLNATDAWAALGQMFAGAQPKAAPAAGTGTVIA
jgi:hypothetical protein